MSEQPITAPKPRARWVKVVLVLSLAANVGIGGLFVGVALRAPQSGAPAAAASPEGIAIIARALPVKYQRQLRQALRDGRTSLQPDRIELGRLRDRLVRALRAKPFDIKAVDRVFAAQRTMLDGILAAGHDAILQQIALMTPRDRQRFIRNLMGRPAKTPPAGASRP